MTDPLISQISWPGPGRYVLAVSGGADSMTLLHLMAGAAEERRYQLVVAHFDHGLRPDSARDRQLVQAAAARYRLPFATHEANLGQGSEARARAARHAWLESARTHHQAAAVVTAHHADDLLETSLLNLARGTGRRGLAPMQDGPILRPLIRLTRAELREYATRLQLEWHEDPTNADPANPRNFLRHHLLTHASQQWRERYTTLISRLGTLNNDIGYALDVLMGPVASSMLEPPSSAPGQLGTRFINLPRALVRDLSLPEVEELLLAAARHLQPGIEPSERTIREMAVFTKTAPNRRGRPLRQGLIITVGPEIIRIESSF